MAIDLNIKNIKDYGNKNTQLLLIDKYSKEKKEQYSISFALYNGVLQAKLERVHGFSDQLMVHKGKAKKTSLALIDMITSEYNNIYSLLRDFDLTLVGSPEIIGVDVGHFKNNWMYPHPAVFEDEILPEIARKTRSKGKGLILDPNDQLSRRTKKKVLRALTNNNSSIPTYFLENANSTYNTRVDKNIIRLIKEIKKYDQHGKPSVWDDREQATEELSYLLNYYPNFRTAYVLLDKQSNPKKYVYDKPLTQTSFFDNNYGKSK